MAKDSQIKSWPHLDTADLDPRWIFIAGYLCKLKDKHIVDLNSGSTRLLFYLPEETYSSYYCNDIRPLRTSLPKVRFEQITDEEARKHLITEKVDVLICAGITMWGTREPQESQTIKNSIVDIVRSHEPKIIILETAEEMVQKWNNLEKITNDFRGYKLIERISIESLRVDLPCKKRIIEIWEKI